MWQSQGAADTEVNSTSVEPTSPSWGLTDHRGAAPSPPHLVERTRWDELRREAQMVVGGRGHRDVK